MVFLVIPLLGVLAWNWFLLFLRTLGGFRIWNLIRVKNTAFERLRETYSRLISRVAAL